MFIKAYASGGAGGRGAGRIVSTPSAPTSVQGRLYASGMTSYLGGTGRGRGRAATYVAPSRTRGR